jgi:hypothetical protein
VSTGGPEGAAGGSSVGNAAGGGSEGAIAGGSESAIAGGSEGGRPKGSGLVPAIALFASSVVSVSVPSSGDVNAGAASAGAGRDDTEGRGGGAEGGLGGAGAAGALAGAAAKGRGAPFKASCASSIVIASVPSSAELVSMECHEGEGCLVALAPGAGAGAGVGATDAARGGGGGGAAPGSAPGNGSALETTLSAGGRSSVLSSDDSGAAGSMTGVDAAAVSGAGRIPGVDAAAVSGAGRTPGVDAGASGGDVFDLPAKGSGLSPASTAFFCITESSTVPSRDDASRAASRAARASRAALTSNTVVFSESSAKRDCGSGHASGCPPTSTPTTSPIFGSTSSPATGKLARHVTEQEARSASINRASAFNAIGWPRSCVWLSPYTFPTARTPGSCVSSTGHEGWSPSRTTHSSPTRYAICWSSGAS